MFEISAIPLVISNIPVNKGCAKTNGICKNLKQGKRKMAKTYRSLLVLKIEIITENSTIKPPISITVETEL